MFPGSPRGAEAKESEKKRKEIRESRGCMWDANLNVEKKNINNIERVCEKKEITEIKYDKKIITNPYMM